MTPVGLLLSARLSKKDSAITIAQHHNDRRQLQAVRLHLRPVIRFRVEAGCYFFFGFRIGVSQPSMSPGLASLTDGLKLKVEGLYGPTNDTSASAVM